MTDFVNLRVSQQDKLLIVQLARAQKRNALNDETVLGLECVFAAIPDQVGAVVLHGDGDHFCAGLDLSELRDRDAFAGVKHSRMWHRVMSAIEFGPVPVVVALHGAVVGGGLELASAAHIRVADVSTFYALPEGQRGIYVGGGASARVPKLIGVSRMMDMMLTGRIVRAAEGERIGLSHYLVESGQSLNKAIELANKIAANTRPTNFGITHVLPRIAEMGQEQGLLVESLMAGIAQDSAEAKVRMNQFLNKQAKKVGEE
ncbi:MAG: crotonase/enoyl-CoA hydratase family protein [Chloroflexi bacterium]|nr:crotonase/enoyl-CoA hydratase family protein [Chloroflexota bacterium]